LEGVEWGRRLEMKVKVVIDETELKNLVYDKIRETLGAFKFDPTAVKILVKSKQNYKSEWEEAEFKAEYEV
jgi:hypothetical protein